MRQILLALVIGAAYGCTHPIDINGQGNVWSYTNERNCSAEEAPCNFQIVDEYLEIYKPIPRAGYYFDRWDSCGNEPLFCRLNVPKVTVDSFYGKTVQAGVANFSRSRPSGQFELITDLHAGGARRIAANYFTPYKDEVYFMGSDNEFIYELWRSDGTLSGTVPVRDERLDPSRPLARDLTVLSGRLFFTQTFKGNQRTWVTDGTTFGTQVYMEELGFDLLRNREDVTGVPFLSYAHHPRGDILFMKIEDEIHVYNTANNQLWGIINNPYRIADTAAAGDSVYVLLDMAQNSNGKYQLWRVSPDNTVRVGAFEKALRASSSPLSTSNIGAIGDYILLGANALGDESLETKLWVSDGTSSRLLADLTDPWDFTRVGDWLLFTAEDDTNGRELWRTDGVTVELVKDIFPGPSNAFGVAAGKQWIAFDGSLFFTATDSNRSQIWRTDGTERGTVPVTANIGDARDLRPEQLTNANGYLYFAGSVNRETNIWRSSGELDDAVSVAVFDALDIMGAANGNLYASDDNAIYHIPAL